MNTPCDRTINIMMIAKCFPINQMKSEIAKYMSEECNCPIECYTDDVIYSIVKTAFIDWLDCCDRPRMHGLINAYFDRIEKYSDETERMLIALGLSQVAEMGIDGTPHNICGFHETDFTRKLDEDALEEETNEKENV